MLVVVRVLTGIGLGGAMPNLIALSSEAVEPRSRSSAVATMYCGIPFGGVIASLIGVLLAGDTEWRHIFYVGGVGPLLLVPLLVWFLPESRAYLDVAGTQAAHQRRTHAVRRRPHHVDGRAVVSYFCTLIVLYFLLNWLPSLMASRGSIARTSARADRVQRRRGLGALGIGAALDRMRASRVVGGMYVGIVLSLAALTRRPASRRSRPRSRPGCSWSAGSRCCTRSRRSTTRPRCAARVSARRWPSAGSAPSSGRSALRDRCRRRARRS